MFLCIWRGHLGSADSQGFFLFLKSNGQKAKKEHRSKNEENDGLGKSAEEIENGREDEVYEKETRTCTPAKS